MIYRQLFNRVGAERVVWAGVIGAGQYATAIITQSPRIPRLDVPVAADVNVEAARRAFRLAGYADEDIRVCESRLQALQAWEQGRRVVVGDALLLMDLPVDVVVESTGVAEAGTRHALEAIRHGKHVAMVTKETDVTVGPILYHRAKQAGVVYTAVDGDQHGLLIGLVEWARELGLEVISGGKSLDPEFVFDPARGTVTCQGQSVTVGAADAWALAPLSPGQVAEVVGARQALLGSLPKMRGSDLAEMAIAANATGLLPDVERFHCPPLRTPEIPEVLCPVEEGGILRRRGVIDSVICLRQPHEAGQGGGVFIVVACENDYSRRILTQKGLIPNSRDSAALIIRPHHLCGVETPMSLLVAGLLGVPTGATEFRPRVDIVARAARDLRAGEILENENSPAFEVIVRPAQPVAAGAPLPILLADGGRAAVDVAAGTLITADMVVPPADSALWRVRAEQDGVFF